MLVHGDHVIGHGVWVVEDASDAFVAAVRFLNRTSTDAVGYYLVRIRFTHGTDGGYQVHFEVLAAPSAWERGPTPPTGKPKNPVKIAFLKNVRDLMAPGLSSAGFPNISAHTQGSALRIAWPADLWFRRYAKRLNVRTVKSEARVNVWSRDLGSREANRAAIEILKERLEPLLQGTLPKGTTLQWCSAKNLALAESVRASLPGAGYGDGNAKLTAEWATTVVALWLDLLRSHPIPDLEDQVAERIGRRPWVDAIDTAPDELDEDGDE